MQDYRLNSEVSAEGKELTSTECVQLRLHGDKCSDHYRVIPSQKNGNQWWHWHRGTFLRVVGVVKVMVNLQLTGGIGSVHAHPVHGIQKAHCGNEKNTDRPQRYLDTVKQE